MHGTYLLTDAERSDGDVGDVPIEVGLGVRGEADGRRRRQKQGGGEHPTARRHRALDRVEEGIGRAIATGRTGGEGSDERRRLWAMSVSDGRRFDFGKTANRVEVFYRDFWRFFRRIISFSAFLINLNWLQQIAT